VLLHSVVFLVHSTYFYPNLGSAVVLEQSTSSLSSAEVPS